MFLIQNKCNKDETILNLICIHFIALSNRNAAHDFFIIFIHLYIIICTLQMFLKIFWPRVHGRVVSKKHISAKFIFKYQQT